MSSIKADVQHVSFAFWDIRAIEPDLHQAAKRLPALDRLAFSHNGITSLRQLDAVRSWRRLRTIEVLDQPLCKASNMWMPYLASVVPSLNTVNGASYERLGLISDRKVSLAHIFVALHALRTLYRWNAVYIAVGYRLQVQPSSIRSSSGEMPAMSTLEYKALLKQYPCVHLRGLKTEPLGESQSLICFCVPWVAQTNVSQENSVPINTHLRY